MASAPPGGGGAPSLYKGEYSYDTMGTNEVGVVSQLDKARTGSFSNISFINDRNRKGNVARAEQGIRAEDLTSRYPHLNLKSYLNFLASNVEPREEARKNYMGIIEG